MTWRMPSETEPHERVWMAFPTAGPGLDEARTAWANVAHAVAEFEPVTMVVDPSDTDTARRFLSSRVDLVETPLDDAWMRDIGPTFVVDEEGRLGAVTWTFNGWGQQDWASWELDRAVGRTVAEWSGAEVVDSPMVNEGGGIHVDGRGTVLVTETVQLDPLRNPGLGKAAVEAELNRTIGATQVIWLRRGLARDARKFGTKGHVDIVATIPEPGVLLVHDQRDPSHPDHAITREVVETLSTSVDADGAKWDIRRIPAPATLRDDEGWVDYSYLNHLVVNGGVIACSFDDPNDDEAVDLLASAYPGRKVVTVDARPIFALGGGIHCITQQQPKTP